MTAKINLFKVDKETGKAVPQGDATLKGAVYGPVSYTHLDVYKRQEQTAAYSVEIWKRFRKWGGIPTGITQNIKDRCV